MTRWTKELVVAGLLVLCACDAEDPPAEEEGDPAALSYAEDVEPIIVASCSCHAETNPAGGLDLSEGNGFDAIVSTPAAGADLDYVAPGDPQNSYLLHKIDGTQADVGGAGVRMPMGGELPEANVIVIEDWIDQGAKP